MKGHASAEDTRPWEIFEIWDPQNAENALKLTILPSPRYFVSFYIFYDPIRWTFLAPGGKMRVHPVHSPAYGPEISNHE